MNRGRRGGQRRVPGEVRIIGGDLRGSKLPVADRDGLRPSGDRLREALFNWLQSVIPGARCLDLFAGSGALGFEAASRGAAEVVMIERDRELARSLSATAQRLRAGNVRVHEADALRWLALPPDSAASRFDLVFLDPPFAAGLWAAALAALDGWLNDDAWLYLEAPRKADIGPASGWRLHRQGQTRDVDFSLWRREPPPIGAGQRRSEKAPPFPRRRERSNSDAG